MRIGIGCDHAGFTLKGSIAAALEADGHDVLDLGTFSSEPVDYPDFARSVGQAVLRGFVELGVLVCGSGVGASIAANKLRGIRAALCHELFTARQSREDDDANVLCLGARVLDEAPAIEITRAWLAARFSGEERHARRIAKIAQIEASAEGPARLAGGTVRPGAAVGAGRGVAAAPLASRRPAPSPPAAATPPAPVAAAPAPPATPAMAAPTGSPGVTAPPASISPPPPPAAAEPSKPAAPTPSAAIPPAPETRPAPAGAAISATAEPGKPEASEPSLAARAAELIRQFTERHGPDTPSSRREGVISLDEEATTQAEVRQPRTRRPEPTAPVGESRPPAVKSPVVEPKPRMPEAAPPLAPVPPGKPGAPEPAKPAKPLPDPFKLPPVEEALQSLETEDFLGRIWVKDALLWTGDVAEIRNRLGWLTSPTIMGQHVDDIKAFADEIRRVQFGYAVLLGMGGSSLSSEVFNHTFGSKMGFPDLVMFDSTDPGAVKRTLERVNIGRSLFVVSTKSGTTTETLSFYALFRQQVEASKAPKPGIQFVAITDAGTPLDKLATDAGFRRTFLNPASIGGRYSALSFFGLVPAALIGVDVKAMLERAQSMVEACAHDVAPRDNPGARLGAALAGLARIGRDKVTLVFSDKLRTLGGWIEQLLAESLGKGGKGLVPVDAEPLGAPSVYGDDRVFVATLLEGDKTHDAALATLAEAGHPVIRFTLADPLDVGAEFFRWELATAAAGALLGVNPFDEPDVASAKEKTAALLAAWKKTRRLPEWGVANEEDAIVLMTPAFTPGSVADGIAAHLAQARPGDYFALQAYLAPHPDVWSRLQEIRTAVRDRYRLATTVAYGPRYLHLTGQLHKGGPANGLFVQVTGEDAEDVAIPGAGYGFSTLKAAQALGDLQALTAAGRRVIRVHLRGKQANALDKLVHVIRSAVKKA